LEIPPVLTVTVALAIAGGLSGYGDVAVAVYVVVDVGCTQQYDPMFTGRGGATWPTP
jgi:hypothetical protein